MDSPRTITWGQQPQQQSAAVEEGRRIYVGNLLYSVQQGEIESLLKDAGFTFERVHISFDPISERNPGYCFVEFSSRDDAERALVSLAGFPISGRPIKVGPCNPKPATQRAEPTARSSPSRPAVRGFGDWRSERQAAAPSAEEPRSSHGAGRVTEAREVDGLRLYVGGLSKTVDADQDQQELSQVFAEFDVASIGKRIAPHESTKVVPGHHHYCFVDFHTRDEAERAMRATNGLSLPGDVMLRVSLAKKPQRPRESAVEGDGQAPSTGRPPRNAGEPNGDRFGRQRVIMQSSSWRTRAD